MKYDGYAFYDPNGVMQNGTGTSWWNDVFGGRRWKDVHGRAGGGRDNIRIPDAGKLLLFRAW